MIEEIFKHRSIRKFSNRPIPKDILTDILEAGIRASNTGNMQIYSIIVTQDEKRKKALAACHFNQPMITQAPVLLTYCVDVRRFSRWCEIRGTKPGYNNFLWFVNGMIDSMLCSQNMVLEAEHHGLGICYLGTTVYTTEKIIEVLNLPHGVIPVTTVVMGYPDQQVELTDRLPLKAVVHFEQYNDPTDEQIEQLWAEKEASELTAKLIEDNKLPTLAHIFAERRYTLKDSVAISESYFETLKKQGFFNQ